MRPEEMGLWTRFLMFTLAFALILAMEREVYLLLALSAFQACVPCVGLMATAGAAVGVPERVVAGMATTTMWIRD